MLHSFRIYIFKITPSLSEISSCFKGINRSVGNTVVFKAMYNLYTESSDADAVKMSMVYLLSGATDLLSK